MQGGAAAVEAGLRVGAAPAGPAGPQGWASVWPTSGPRGLWRGLGATFTTFSNLPFSYMTHHQMVNHVKKQSTFKEKVRHSPH